MNNTAFCDKNMEKIETPFLVISAGIDKLVSPDGGKELVERA